MASKKKFISDNKYLLQKELQLRELLINQEHNNKFKYPLLDDQLLQFKLFKKTEFYLPYVAELVNDIEKESESKCFGSFKLTNHQKFVKNFFSNNSPYNGLLLYHGLGSGKTCSAISVTETYRLNMIMGQKFKKIIIIASPNVQENFKLQLFDHTKYIKLIPVGVLKKKLVQVKIY